jgi:hypothetical protein
VNNVDVSSELLKPPRNDVIVHRIRAHAADYFVWNSNLAPRQSRANLYITRRIASHGCRTNENIRASIRKSDYLL